ncbi:hypothetical protein [Streptomyces morookaense]|uniref:Uncharacterized protein n=1 Tax=Streptomyces morookaense TaxID=1970 RepID=A0A7Y7E9J1_STRMO|nr:hypothetical protein [Streptomyces morookaense]NVK81078.1 hypothetical protein [Streptomyces morookaense]GHF14734.1 hypothetical protein GCM10010359_15040 [Streptomyces morookaense]
MTTPGTTTLDDTRDGLTAVPEHGHVLPVWDVRGFSDEHLLFLDRHLDLKHVPAEDCRALAALRGRSRELAAACRRLPFREPGSGRYGLDDFLYPALAGGWLASVCWVVPGEAGRNPAAALLGALSLVPHVGHRVIETFTREPWGVRTELPVGTLACTGLHALGPDVLDNITAVDVDLDYFVDSDGRADHTVAEVMNQLGPWAGKMRSWSGSLSVSSGFVPAACGTALATRLARELGMPLRTPAAEVFTGTSGSPAPERSLAAAARGTPLGPAETERLWDEELAPLGAEGLTLRAVLDAQSGRTDEALTAVHRARRHGGRATWAAYVTGLAAMRARQHATALGLFDLCTETVSDTLDAHAGILGVICALRLGRTTEGVQRARRALQTTPLHRDLPGLLALAGRRSGDGGAERDAQRHADVLAELWHD